MGQRLYHTIKGNKLPEAKIFKNLHISENLEQAKAGLKGLSGIYCFRHIASGKIYIGQALDLSVRIIQHLNGNLSNILLQRALKKYGLEAFEFIVVEFVEDTSLLTTREQVHLNWLFSLSADLRYNLCPTAGSWLGYTHTAETKAQMSASHLGLTPTAEAKVLMSVRNCLGNTNRLGTTHTAESIDNIRLNQPNRMSVFVYDLNDKLVGEFPSQGAAAKCLNCNVSNISRNVDSGKRFRKIYLITTGPLP